jgi:serine phosphatase RsbU (regulator of sigma subunit)/anti-sigma regulatory factor (Ser/Thr protein kinase)
VIRTGTLGVHASFAPTAESIAAARRLIRRALADWPVGDLGDDALLVVSELATNAVIHAGTEFTVSCTHLGTAIRLAVRDSYPSRGLPAMMTVPTGERTSGRGLLLCASLAASWGVEYDRRGKTVWCHLGLPEAAEPASGGLLAAVTLDPAGVIRDWTSLAAELFGWTAAEAVGRPFAELARETADGGPASPGSAERPVTDLLLLHRDGHQVPVHTRFLPVGAKAPSVVLLAPRTQRYVFEPPPRPARAEEERRGDVLAALDSDRVPAHELPQRAAEACCDFLGGDAAYLMLVDDSGELRVAGSTGLPDSAGSYVEQTDDVLRATPEHIPQVIDDLARTARAPAPLLAAGMRSSVSVPVLVDGRLTGRLTVASTTPGRFSHDDAVRLHLATAQLARQLDRARITELERRRRGWLSYLAEASDLLAGTLEPQATIAVLAQLMVPRLATWCAVLVPDDRGRPRLRHVWHADETLLDALRELVGGAEPPAQAATAATPWAGLAGPGATDAGPGPPGADRIRSGPVVTLSLTARGRALGVVVLGREPGQRFGRDVLDLVEETCRRAALILDNAVLYSDHLATSQALQRSLLPARLPSVEQLDVGVAYQAKGEGQDVGGDFYDLFAVGPGVWRFTIGDVCGSGPQAAAITGLARNALRILGRHGLPLAEVLARLNAMILDEWVGSRFLTALHGEIRPDPRGGVLLSLVAAGHPPPYLLTPGAEPQQVGKPQPLLGVLPEVSHAPEDLWLQPGQMLVCLTDGVLERRHGNRLLGEDGLTGVLTRCTAVSAGTAAAMVQQAVLDYSREPVRDDFAVLALRALG